MTKTLTQDVFANAPEWVRSAAVDEVGNPFIPIIINTQK